jgi:nucleotide-binding universal stress UspA family protein
MFKKILVPLDGSQMAEAALNEACNLAQATTAEMVLVHVNVPIASRYYPSILSDPTEIERDMSAESNRYLQRVATTLNERGIRATTVQLHDPAVADAILNYADHNGVDMIAMSTHGRSGIGRWLLGSVTDRVIHGANMPVFLVRPDLSTP